ncbi:uncharacterized protein ACDP82_019288 [Pangshura tecta]
MAPWSSPTPPQVSVLWQHRAPAHGKGNRCSYNSSLPTPTSYAWYQGGQKLEGSQQEMVLKSITAEQAGEYHCQAANGIGQSPSPHINITVQFAPPIWASMYFIGPTAAVVLLLLVGLVGITAWSKMRRKRQGMSSNAHQLDQGETPMSEPIYENAQHYGLGKPACVRRMSPRRDHRAVPGVSGRHRGVPHV